MVELIVLERFRGEDCHAPDHKLRILFLLTILIAIAIDGGGGSGGDFASGVTIQYPHQRIMNPFFGNIVWIIGWWYESNGIVRWHDIKYFTRWEYMSIKIGGSV